MEKKIFRQAKSRIVASAFVGGCGLLMPLHAPALGSATLAWDPINQGEIAGYNVYYGNESHMYTRSVSAGINTSATVSGLARDTTYFFAVKAFNDEGLEGEFSEEVSCKVSSTDSCTFNGLFYEQAGIRQSSAGLFKLSANGRGTCSGWLRIGTARHSFSGRLTSLFQAPRIMGRAGAATATLQLNLGPGAQTDEIVGRVTDGQWVSSLLAFRAVSKPHSTTAPYAGSYTLIVPGQDDNPDFPAGHGFARVRVNGSGAVYFDGTLADGGKMTGSTFVSQNGQWPFYLPLRSGKESVMGWITFTNQAASDLSGTLTWIKQADATAPSYSSGFTNPCAVNGSHYTSMGRARSPLTFTAGSAAFGGGNLVAAFSKPVTFAGGRMSGDGIVVNFSSPAGTFKGEVTDPTTARKFTFRGAVLQAQNAGYGFLPVGDQSSRVSIVP